MNQWLLFIIYLGSLSLYCQAESKNLNSTITSVTVYEDRAAVTRQAQIKLPAGENQLNFIDLPNEIDINSIQLNVQATTPTSILDITTSSSYKQQNTEDRLQKIHKQITILNQQINELIDKDTLLANQQAFIDQAQKVILAPSKDASRPTASDLKSIIQISKDKLSQILTQQRIVAKQRADLEKQMDALKDQLTPLQDLSHRTVKNVAVHLNLTKPALVKLNLTYVISGATWYPVYDARFNSKTKQLVLNYFGEVSQSTGEDWSHVKLTLATAKPALGGNAPTLTNWLIDELKPQPQPYPSLPDKSVAEASNIVKKNRLAQYKEAQVQMSNIDSSVTSASFNITKPISLMSGNHQQKVAITDIKLTSEVHYITVPRLTQTAYLQAKTINNSQFPLLMGNLHIFMDNKYISNSRLATTLPSEELKLDLGADEAIAVTFKQLRRYTEKTGFTSSTEKVTYEYLITVKNNKPTTEKITLLDHFPVSQDKQINVKLLSPNPATDKFLTQDKEGKLSWNWILKPNDKREVTVSFSAEYPVMSKVSGLPQE